MRTFTDSKGDKWSINLSLDELVRVKEQTDIMLVPLTKAAAKDKDFQAHLAGLLDDPVTLGKVLWALLEDQAEKLKLDEQGVRSRFDGEALGEAVAALAEEITVFTQSRQDQDRVRTAIRNRQKKIESKRETNLETLLKMIETAPLDENESASSNSATGSPASSAATLGP